MQGVKLNQKQILIIVFRIVVELLFFIYLIYRGENFENVAAFLVAVTAAEGYKLLGTFSTLQNSRFRELVGLLIGVLNGIIFMITIFLTGYINTEIWLFTFLSIILTASEYGIYGAVAESLVMMSLYVVTGGIAELDLLTLFIRAFTVISCSVILGFIADQELKYEKRFLELEKMKDLTKDQKSRFIGLISHSLRTPITTISGYIDLLLNERVGKLKQEQVELVVKLKEEAGELRDLAEDFLTVSTLENEKIKIDYVRFDICALCNEIYEEMLPMTKEKNLKFDFNCNTDICDFEGERSKLENAIKNIIDNAIKFTPQEGTVKFIVSGDSDYVYIDVEDTGIGIPEKEQKNLFSMFSRATNILKYYYKGVGLGLYMSRLIIEAHGGRIELESEEGVGSKFKIILPTGKLASVVRKLAGRVS